MSTAAQLGDVARELAEAKATIKALLSGQIDAVFDANSKTPLMLFGAQAALRDSEARYRRIVETANEGIMTVDPQAHITFVNRRLADILGYSIAELTAMSLFDLIPPEGVARVAKRVERAAQGASEENELEVPRKSGSPVWVFIKTSPIRDDDGKFIGILAMVTDKTLHKEADEALRKSEQQYRQIVEATTDGIVKIDSEAVVVFVNHRFAEMLGYEPEAMVGSSIFDFMSVASRAVVAESLRSRLRGVKDPVDTSFRHKNGSDIEVNIAGAPLFDSSSEYAGNLAVIRDVTERKKMQSQLMVSDRMASVGSLAAGVAHEINNPLAAVVANLDYIAKTLEPVPRTAVLDEVASALDDARHAAERVRLIVRDLKIFSRSPIQEPRGLVDVQATMESSLRMGWNEIRHRARLVRSYEETPPVEANEARLGQVFLNLIINAAQALEDGKAEQNEIRVSTRSESDRVIVEVADTGTGIPPEIIDRIFDAFFTTKDVGGGTGLGLAICRRIVTDMGGELTVVSALGKGTTFRLSLPMSQRRSDPVLAPVAEQRVSLNRRGNVLFVDDEPLLLTVVRRILGQEHELVTTATAKDALARCSAGEKYDLILCDLMMPNMSGMDLYDALLVVSPEHARKMVFVTGGAFTPKARQFLSESQKEHIEKPFDPDNLRAFVQRYIRSSE